MIALAMALLATSGACDQCHKAESAAHARTPMAHALQAVKDCQILKTRPALQFQQGRYSYSIRRDGDRSIYSVTDGSHSVTAPLEWAFGLGEAGQTYVYQRNGVFYESRVSYYKAIDGLDLTLGAHNQTPANLEEAAGRRMDAADQRDCFHCHATSAVRGQALHLETLIPGIQCERCHGPSEDHVRSVRDGKAIRLPPAGLSKLSTEEQSDFCGGCHRTWAQIAAQGPHSLLNVRFQPYRLTSSQCYDATDRRIACTSCHDPHEHTQRTAGFFDAKCVACHSGTSVKICKVSTQNCVSCHMPKVELPGAHFSFTDHRIRIVKPGEPYPD